MRLNRSITIKLAVFATVALTLLGIMLLHFAKVPATYFGVGRYTVTIELPEAGGLYGTSNVTYRGVEVGQVKTVRLTRAGVEAVLSLKSDVRIPSDLKAEVHSQSAIGEQYVELLPRNPSSRPLKNGDVITAANTSVPPDINTVLDSLVTDLKAVPHDSLKTVIDETYTAVNGLGPQLSTIVKGSTKLAIDARKNLGPLLTLIDQAQPVLDSQTNTSTAIQAWASHLATVSTELHDHDHAVAGLLDNAAPALGEVRQLIDRLDPTLPVLLANLVSVGKVAVAYRADLEQTLVMVPQLVADSWGSALANMDTKQRYRGAYLSFNLNLNLPPPCTTGYLPAQQRRVPSQEDYPQRPEGLLYCRVPQNSPYNVRGARNIPCETVPGKRAASVKLCESKQEYVPLNDGVTWKGDPNATYTGQDIPELPPGSGPHPPPAAGPPPPATVPYEPGTGTYTGPDGKQYTQSDLAPTTPKDNTWQHMLLPTG